MITRRGAGIITVAIAVFFLASATRVGWVHLADAVLWGVILLSLVIPWLSMPGLRLERTLGKNNQDRLGPFEGDEVPVGLKLQNRWWLPRFLVAVSYPVTVGQSANTVSTESRIFFWTWPRRTGEANGPLRLERRGQHTLGEVLIQITGPFGMFRRRRRIAMSHGVLAYPMWKPMQRLGILETQVGEDEGRRKSRTGVDAGGTRAYVPGDPYRSIHWRNSARTGHLAVREFDSWNDRAVAFAIDTKNVTGESPDSSLDYTARLAASCARVIEQEGGTVSVLTATGDSPEFMAWSSVMEHLARLEPEEPVEVSSGSLANRISSLRAGRRLIAFLTAGSEAEAAAVNSAAKRGIACVAVVFSESEEATGGADSTIQSLQQSGVPVVQCAPGALDRALAEIENGIGAGTRTTKSASASQRVAA